jgi:hypothetical protein
MRNDFTLAIQMLQKANNPTIDPDDESFVKPNQDINKDYSSYTLKWQQIVAYFNSVQAPESCRSLAATYGQALSNYSSTYIRIQIALSKNDLSTLMSLKKSVNKDVDAGLRSADNEVSAVCRTYGITKTFTVDPDDGGDSLLSPGL